MTTNMTINFAKRPNGLVPAIIQDAQTKNVLMLGYMNQEAVDKTLASGKVTFFSRSKNRLWTKGETSGHYMRLADLKVDCDQDAILIRVNPTGPVCHTGTDTCWHEENNSTYGFISKLEDTITNRIENAETTTSYVASLFEEGINKVAQKVGEEAIEMVIEAKDNNSNLFLNESADLLFHYLLLLQAKGFKLNDVVDVLRQREK